MRCLLLSCCLLLTPAALAGEEPAKFFADSVRPLLEKRCLGCHGEKKQEAALRLDTLRGLLKGADTGPVVVPGHPEKSRMIEVIHFAENDTQMPPAGKMSDDEIATLTRWVKEGAHFPAAGDELKIERQPHWAFQPLQSPRLSDVKQPAWCLTPLDRFILAKLETKQLAGSSIADRRTLIRRATIDLLGIPPTWEEVHEFENDPAPDAYERLVDRLLASPHYGERWGRHWLDIARYADSKGYVFTEDIRYPYAYTYRNYVIDALNADLPYDQFIRQQLAADRLQLPEKAPELAAMGFLTVGQRFRNSEQDIIDDRIDVVSRGLMGLTVTCARCHDHKFDPIPSEDYYSLYGVFASSQEPKELPLIGEPDQSPEYLKFKAELDKRQAVHDDYFRAEADKLIEKFREACGDYLLAAAKSAQLGLDGVKLEPKHGELNRTLLTRWERYLQSGDRRVEPALAPWFHLSRIELKEFPRLAAEKLQALANRNDPSINPKVLAALRQKQPKNLIEVAEVYRDLLAGTRQRWLNAQLPASLPDAADEQLRQLLYGPASPLTLNDEEISRLFPRDIRDRARDLQKKVDEWRASSEAAPPRAMVMVDKPDLYNPYVFLRGNAGRRGATVPRRFLRAIAPPDAQPFQRGSGRLDLADAIVDSRNPLTARVLVNRLWLHHFGQSLVDTPDDFGARSLPPSHPELLDYLAGELIGHGWSIKHLHREIMLSATYRQSSQIRPEAVAVDPENQLYWRRLPRRLEFETMRDSLLAASGRLEPVLHSRPARLDSDDSRTLRTIYLFVDRNNLPTLFRVFDFANVDASTGMRPRTTVPQQALFLMNSPFVREQAIALANRPAVKNAAPAEAIAWLFRHLLLRNPSDAELRQVEQFLQSQPADGNFLPRARLAQILLASNEFFFVD